MYEWRKMSPVQRLKVLKDRQSRHVPWHGPPHFENENHLYLITAATFEHHPVIGFSSQRMASFETDLLKTAGPLSARIFAWCILPNHYHVLLQSPIIRDLLVELGKLHGRTSFQWNGEDDRRGRQVWHRAAETGMKSENHFWATLNYVLHNAVRHGYFERWQDWPYSNAADYLADVGRDEATRRWREFPILGYGDGWDPIDL